MINISDLRFGMELQSIYNKDITGPGHYGNCTITHIKRVNNIHQSTGKDGGLITTTQTITEITFTFDTYKGFPVTVNKETVFIDVRDEDEWVFDNSNVLYSWQDYENN